MRAEENSRKTIFSEEIAATVIDMKIMLRIVYFHVCCSNKYNVSKINDDSYNVVTMTRARSHRTQVRDMSRDTS